MTNHHKNNWCHPTLAACFGQHRRSYWRITRDFSYGGMGHDIASIAFPRDDAYSRTIGYYTHSSWLYHELQHEVRMPPR